MNSPLLQSPLQVLSRQLPLMTFKDVADRSKYRHTLIVGFANGEEVELPEIVVAAMYEINEKGVVGQYLRHVCGQFGVIDANKAVVTLCLSLWIRAKELGAC